MKSLSYDYEHRERVDSFLTANFEYSRNFFHHIIARGWVLVDWKVVKKSYRLKMGDKIEIDNLERYLDSVYLEEFPFVDIPIVLEKQDYLVINKPKGVLSHPNSVWDLSTPSVVARAYSHYKDLPSIWNFIRAGLVHRLDKDTSWLMILAKTERALEHFKKLFQEKSTKEKIEEKEKIPLHKFYRARVKLTDPWVWFLNSMKFPFYIEELVKPKVPYPWEFKIWITKLLDLKEDEIFLEILTWRTHQIRYHLSSKNLPIIWDNLYWVESDKPMHLESYRLSFQDPDNKFVDLQI